MESHISFLHFFFPIYPVLYILIVRLPAILVLNPFVQYIEIIIRNRFELINVFWKGKQGTNFYRPRRLLPATTCRIQAHSVKKIISKRSTVIPWGIQGLKEDPESSCFIYHWFSSLLTSWSWIGYVTLCYKILSFLLLWNKVRTTFFYHHIYVIDAYEDSDSPWIKVHNQRRHTEQSFRFVRLNE